MKNVSIHCILVLRIKVTLNIMTTSKSQHIAFYDVSARDANTVVVPEPELRVAILTICSKNTVPGVQLRSCDLILVCKQLHNSLVSRNKILGHDSTYRAEVSINRLRELVTV